MVNFINQNNTSIIVGLALVVTALLLFLSFRKFLLSSGSSGLDASDSNMGQIEELLKQVLAKSHVVTTSDGAQAIEGSSAGAEVLEQIKALQIELKTKQSELEIAKKQSAGIDPEEKKKLEERVKELEAKLGEYEIIAEDIADLSKYKEENIALKKKLSELESSQGSTPGPAPRSIPVEPQAVAPKVEVAPPAAEPEPVNTPEGPIGDDLMAEFAKAVQDQKKQEFESVAPPDDPSVDLTSLLSEASSLQIPSGNEVVNALEQEINPEKLAAEASNLEKVKTEDIQLMDNFENFVKGQ